MVSKDWEVKTKTPVMKWLKDKGYDIRIEVKIDGKFADIAGVKKNKFIIVECKESDGSLEYVLDQCMRYTKCAHEVYIAFLKRTLKKFSEAYDINSLPFGIFSVSNGKAFLIRKPKPLNPKKQSIKKSIKTFHKSMNIDRLNISWELDQSIWMRRLKGGITTKNVWFYVLLLLQKRGKIHTYKLRNLISKEYGFSPGMITVYRAVYSLENGDLIDSIKEGNRKYYTIKPKGTLCLMKAKEMFKELSLK